MACKGHYPKKSILKKTSRHRDYLKKGPGFSSKEKKFYLAQDQFQWPTGVTVSSSENHGESTHHIGDVSQKKLSGLITNTGTCLVFKSHSRFKERVLKNKQTKATRGCHIENQLTAMEYSMSWWDGYILYIFFKCCLFVWGDVHDGSFMPKRPPAVNMCF